MTDSPKVAAARIDVARARARLVDSVQAFETPVLDLKNQLTPSHIMGDVLDLAKSKSADLVEDAVDAVRARPVAAGGAVAAIVLFLTRQPLMNAASKAWNGVSTKRRKKAPSTIKTTESTR